MSDIISVHEEVMDLPSSDAASTPLLGYRVPAGVCDTPIPSGNMGRLEGDCAGQGQGGPGEVAWTFTLPSNTDSLEGTVADVCRFLLDKRLITCPSLRASLDTADRRRTGQAGDRDRDRDMLSLGETAVQLLSPAGVSAFIDAVCGSELPDELGGVGGGLGGEEEGLGEQDVEVVATPLGEGGARVDRARLQQIAAAAVPTTVTRPHEQGMPAGEGQPGTHHGASNGITSTTDTANTTNTNSSSGTVAAHTAGQATVCPAGGEATSGPGDAALPSVPADASKDTSVPSAAPSITPPPAPRMVLELSPGPGAYPFTYKGQTMELELRQLDRVHTVMQGMRLARRVDILLRVRGCSQARAARAVASLCAEAHTWAESLLVDATKSVRLHLNKDGYWSLSYKPKRSLDTLYLPANIKDKAKNEVARFLKERSEYERFGVPYRRCFLLAGPPGTGKTSLIHALASTFDLSLYVLSITPKTDDTSLMSQLSAAGDKRSVSLVVLEDVDALFTRDRQANSSSAAAVSFSGLLNALDGLGSPSGLILVLTTNYLDRLDPALIRPGRVDTILRFEHLSKEQVAETWSTLLPHAIHALPAFLRKMESSSSCSRLAPATLQKFLFDHRTDSPADILASFSELEELASYFKQRHAVADGAFEAYTL